MSAGILLALLMVLYPTVKLGWVALEPTADVTYNSRAYKYVMRGVSVALIALSAAILLGASSLVAAVAIGYLALSGVAFVWQLLDDAVVIKWHSAFYVLFCVLVEVAMIVAAIIAL